MKKTLTPLITFLFTSPVFAQPIISGDYDSGLKLSYDTRTKKLTGYFENYTGLDEATNTPRFSCIFYIEGIVAEPKFNIVTYYSADKSDSIKGTIEIVDNKTVKIKLAEEHGGCWNVQHFADEPARFGLNKSFNWLQIRYIATNKAYLHSEKSTRKRLKSYLVKGDFVCVEKIEQDWAYCTYFGKKVTKGWLKLPDLNRL